MFIEIKTYVDDHDRRAHLKMLRVKGKDGESRGGVAGGSLN